MQFCMVVSTLSIHIMFWWQSYPAHNFPAALAVANHVACAFSHTTARQSPFECRLVLAFLKSRTQLRLTIGIFVAAVQRMFDELTAVLEQIGTELPACPRQIVQRIEVELGGKLTDYPALIIVVSIHQGAESNPCYGKAHG